MIVVDASVILEILLNTSASPRIWERLLAPAETLHAPHLIDVEVAQVLRRYASRGQIDAARGLDALNDLADFPISRYPHDLFLPRVWELRQNVSAYDAVYLALAEGLKATLLTRDAKLAATAGRRASVELI